MRVVLVVLVTAITLGGCAAKEAPWVRMRDDAQSLKSARYWCTTQRREKFHRMHPDTTGRKKSIVVSDKCMNSRGWRRGK